MQITNAVAGMLSVVSSVVSITVVPILPVALFTYVPVGAGIVARNFSTAVELPRIVNGPSHFRS